MFMSLVARLKTGQLDKARVSLNEVERLRVDVESGKRKLLIKASYPKAVPSFTTATGKSDAASLRLDNTAERNYWTLRDRIATSKSQIDGLQEYIRTQCN